MLLSARQREQPCPIPSSSRFPTEWAKRAYVDDVGYRAMHAAALADPEAFWGKHGQRLDWIKPYTKVKDTSFNEADFHIRWYEDGVLNVSANCIDRHLAKRGDQIAIIWEGDDPHQSRHITYRELHDEVCRFANVLKARGVKQRRPRHHLPADDPRGGLRHARLRAHRRRPFGRVRRLLARRASPTASRIATPRSSSPPTKACAAARSFR